MSSKKFPDDDISLFTSANYLITNAERLIGEFRKESDKFFKINKPKLIKNKDRQTGENVYSLQFPYSVPLELRHLVNNIANDLRHSLDHALYDTAMQIEKCAKKQIQFPIGEKPEDVERKLKSLKRHMHPSIVEYCENLQPYKGGKNHTIWILGRLSGRSKHNRLAHIIPSIHSISYPLDQHTFTAPVHLDPRFTDTSREIEICRGIGEIIGDLCIGMTMHIDTSSIEASPEGYLTLNDCVKKCRNIVFGLKAEASRILGC